MPCKSVSSFDIGNPTRAILGSIAKNSFDSSDLTLVCQGRLQVSRFIRLLSYSDIVVINCNLLQSYSNQ